MSVLAWDLKVSEPRMTQQFISSATKTIEVPSIQIGKTNKIRFVGEKPIV